MLRARPLNAFPFTSLIAIPKSRRRIIIYIYISLSKNPMPRDEITSIRFFSSSSYVSGVTHTPTLSACLVLVRITCRKIHTHILFPPRISTILVQISIFTSFHRWIQGKYDVIPRNLSTSNLYSKQLLYSSFRHSNLCVSGKGKVSISKSRARMES